MDTVTIIVLIYAAVMSAAAFVLYWIDKQKAKKNAWRIPEAVLLGVALLGGALGALIGMYALRHKTQHQQFTRWVPIYLVINLAVYIALIVLL